MAVWRIHSQLDLNLVLRRDCIQLELVIWGSSLYSWYVSLLEYGYYPDRVTHLSQEEEAGECL